jgi:hypothetical protein
LKRQIDNVEKNMKENPMLQTKKPLAFGVKDEGCQAKGPALFGGTDRPDAVFHGHVGDDSSARLRDSPYLEGLHDGYIEGMEKGLALLRDYMSTHVQPMAHVVEDAGDRKRREESKPVYVQGHNVDVRTCKHWYSEPSLWDIEECAKCGLRRFNPDKAVQ